MRFETPPSIELPNSVWVPDRHPGMTAMLPLAVAVFLLGLTMVLVGELEEIVEAGWFGQTDQLYYASLGARWVSVFVVSLALYGVTLAGRAVADIVRKNAHVEWASRFLGFIALLSWLMSLHLIILTEIGRGHRGAVLLPPEAHLLLVASLVALLWPVVFRLPAEARIIRALFLASVAFLGLALLVLDPYLLETWAVALGLRPPPIDVVVTARFLWALPYLVPIGPLVWSSFQRWRETRASASMAAG